VLRFSSLYALVRKIIRSFPCAPREQLRVRHHGDAARLEVETAVLADVVARREEVVQAVRAAGFRFVALDLEGFRSGSLNRGLPEAQASEEES